MKTLCTIYRSPRREGMYLYVERKEDLARVPEALLDQFGQPEQALVLVLTPGRKLAHADATRVLQQIDEQGYYLQMPPKPANELGEAGRSE